MLAVCEPKANFPVIHFEEGPAIETDSRFINRKFCWLYSRIKKKIGGLKKSSMKLLRFDILKTEKFRVCHNRGHETLWDKRTACEKTATRPKTALPG